MANKPILALMYDFDCTLSPRDMEEYAFIPGLGVTPQEFWAECNKTARKYEMDGILAYMLMMLQMSEGKQLVTRETLNAVGRHVELFPGVETWFGRINAYAASKGLTAEHYSISSGIKEIIEGTPIAGEFKEIYAASFCYRESGVPFWPATAVNFTSKTQFIYRINKGVLSITEDRELNEHMDEEDKRVPFSHMIYIGDGITDVPCMKLTKQSGGYSVAVYNDDSTTAERLQRYDRVSCAVKADYREGSALEQTVFAIIDKIAEENRND